MTPAMLHGAKHATAEYNKSMCDVKINYLCHNKLYFVIIACGCGLVQRAFNKIVFYNGVDNL